MDSETKILIKKAALCAPTSEKALLGALEVYHACVVAPLERRVRATRPESRPTTPVQKPAGQTTGRAGELRLRAKRLREVQEILEEESLPDEAYSVGARAQSLEKKAAAAAGEDGRDDRT